MLLSKLEIKGFKTGLELTEEGKEEIALMILLWKDFKAQGKFDRKLSNLRVVQHNNPAPFVITTKLLNIDVSTLSPGFKSNFFLYVLLIVTRPVSSITTVLFSSIYTPLLCGVICVWVVANCQL